MYTIKTGSINDLTKDYDGWILGSFVRQPSIFHTDRFEVKWIEKKKGETRENLSPAKIDSKS